MDVKHAPLKKAFIGIAGLIGVGKSTLAKKLADHMDLPVHYEPVKDNAYLEDFYQDTARHSFAMQVYLLNRRFQQHQEIIWSGRGAVQDRTIYEDSIFAKVCVDMGLMHPRDYEPTSVSLRTFPTSCVVPAPSCTSMWPPTPALSAFKYVDVTVSRV
jgi:deoxyadenosine kinase